VYSVCLSGDHFEEDSSLVVISVTSTSDLSRRCTSVVALVHSRLPPVSLVDFSVGI
jgi:hypothetical protein